MRGFSCECQDAGNLGNVSCLEILSHDFLELFFTIGLNKKMSLPGMSVQRLSLQNLAAAAVFLWPSLFLSLVLRNGKILPMHL